jgi:NAD(P)-dependent dehydrogenase (short-subunit alcohol dehydrogenase family)
MDWKGRICVVIEVGSDIGAGIARYAAGQGMRVIGADIDTAAESLYKELAQESAEVTASVLCTAAVAARIWQSERLRP